ncbi:MULTISPECIES: three-helix bundle dimerization domain-containing protein [Streptomyces]|uniref:three-helix bundle dimerization domain-containing protein n=2 Tax=Streptomyces TaxID=1883 RepID=UPI000A5D6DB5|nr:hypothetical protein [Streptomyces virginiae]
MGAVGGRAERRKIDLPDEGRAARLGSRRFPLRKARRVMPESEDALAIRHVTERLMEAHPQLDVMLVQSSVQTAYEELRYARVRTYLPVLMERRAKDLLPPDRQPKHP